MSRSTKTGLKVKARLDKGKYPPKIKLLDEEMAPWNIEPHKIPGGWNYAVRERNQKKKLIQVIS